MSGLLRDAKGFGDLRPRPATLQRQPHDARLIVVGRQPKGDHRREGRWDVVRVWKTACQIHVVNNS